MSQQRTIEHEVELEGLGLFTGLPVHVRFKPAAPGTGVTFVRSDAPEPVRVAAHIENLTKRARRSSLKNGTLSIETVEHCLAAIRGLEIDNIEVELDNQELPGVDGSSRPYVDVLQSAGAREQDAERHGLQITQLVRVTEGEAELVAWPGEPNKLEIIYELDYGPGGPMKPQIFRFTLSPEVFKNEVAPARTFVFEHEARYLREQGLGTHLGYKDILVIGPGGPIENEYRFADECVRHKVLDLIGDLMLYGAYVYGRIFARRSGHDLNHKLVQKLHEVAAAEKSAEQLRGRPKLDINAVQRILPHRYPMLLVDKVVEVDGDRRAVGVKNVTINEPFFQGHYPRQPIMPGVMVIEAMAQLGGLLLSQKLEHTGKLAVLLSIDKVKFRRQVVPGDQLVIEAHNVRVRSNTGQVWCQARVGNERVAEASIRFMMLDADPT